MKNCKLKKSIGLFGMLNGRDATDVFSWSFFQGNQTIFEFALGEASFDPLKLNSLVLSLLDFGS